MRLALAVLILLASQTQAEVPKVVTDIVPVASLTAQVMGDLGHPELLLDSGASAHDFQLRPSQAAALADADVVIWVGPEMTPWLERALAGTGTGGTVLELLADEGTHRREPGMNDDGQSEHGHDDGHSGTDPHAWLDPANAVHWLGLIAEALAGKDPENAATYRANAEATRTALAATEAQVGAKLSRHANARFVVMHDAYGYFTGYFSLPDAAAIAGGDAVNPGAERLADLRDQVKTEAIACIFPEIGHDPALAELMTEGTGARLGRALDPEGIALDAGPEAYAAILSGLATAIDDCLSGR